MQALTEPFLKIQKIFINELEPKVNFASVADKIILFKEIKLTKHELHTKIQLTKYLLQINASFMLFHFGNNSKNARLHFGKAHGNKACSFFLFLCLPSSKKATCEDMLEQTV